MTGPSRLQFWHIPLDSGRRSTVTLGWGEPECRDSPQLHFSHTTDAAAVNKSEVCSTKQEKIVKEREGK